MSKQESKTKGMCIATRCTSVEHFIQMFHRFVDEESFFVSTLNTRPPGMETSFSVQLQNGTPVLRGMCVVMQAWTTPNNPFKSPGVRLAVKRLTANSAAIFQQLLAAKKAALEKLEKAKAAVPPIPPPPPSPVTPKALAAAAPKPSVFTETLPHKQAPSNVELRHPASPVRPPTPLPIEREPLSDGITAVNPVKPPRATTPPPSLQTPPDLPTPVHDEERTPGSDFVLPANPLMDLDDESLEGYVECTLYEETGNFFPADDEGGGAPLGEVIEPPRPDAVTTPPRFDMPPQTDASDHSETTPVPVRASAPSLPPPLLMPRESAPAPDARARGVDEPEISIERAKPKSRGRWWLVGVGFAAIAAAACAVFWTSITEAFSSRMSRAAPAVRPQQEARAQPAPPQPTPIDPPKPQEKSVTEPAVAPPDQPAADEPAPPPGGGPPVVGDGACRLVINSTPTGSIVQLDDKVIAPSPITVATTCEQHKIDIVHARYQTATRTLALKAGKRDALDVTLMRPTHSVTVASTPAGATIFLNGRRAGTTPTVLKVLGWEPMTLELKKTGYQPASERLYSRTPDDKVSVKLVKW